MLEKLISYCLHRKSLIVVSALLIGAIGIYSYKTLPIDAFPDVTNIQVEIIANAPGLSALEIERFVTYPVETAMRGLPGIVQVRSVTKFGVAVVTIVFKNEMEMYFARQLVFERLSDVEKDIPKNVNVDMGPVATAMGEVYQFTLEGKMPADSAGQIKYLTELRTMEEWIVTPMLKNIPGVSEVNSFGGYFKQYQVVVSPEMLMKYNLTVDAVFRAIENNNQNVGGNILDRYADQYVVRGVGLIHSLNDIENIVLKSETGVPVFMKDVAQISIGKAVRQGAALMNGTDEAVGGVVMMLRGENSREVVERVKEKVDEINENNILPGGIRIKPYYQRSDIVESSINTVGNALLEGSILVLIILFIFLRDIRAAMVVLLALPLSLLITFFVMKLAGLSANLMSLGGLAVSIGMIIDATIIQVENVHRHLTEKSIADQKLTTVLRAVLEVRKPSIFGELIIAVTFLPILSLQGLEGKMFTPLALTVAIALVSSLLLSVFIIPVFTLIFLKPKQEKESIVLLAVKKIYQPLLTWSMQRKYIVMPAAAGLFLIALWILPRLGTEFIPIMDEGAFDMDVQLLPGVSLEKSLEINRIIGQKLKRFPELETTVARIGQTGIALEARGVDKSMYSGILKPRSEWKSAATRDELTNAFRQSLSGIPGIVFSFSQPIQCRIDELVAGTRAQVLIKIFGDDMNILKTKADEVADILSRMRGTTDLVVEQTAGQSYLSVTIDRNKIARHGLNVSDVLHVIEIAIGGKAATKVYEENRYFDVNIRFEEEHRNSVETIGDILIQTQQGYNVPLHELADIAIAEGPVQVSRENGQRRIGIEVNIKDRDIGSYVDEAKMLIKKKANLPVGYYITWGGQFENQQRAMNRLMIIAPVVIVLILFFLYITFKSIRLALLVICNLPFALIGGVFALFVSGLYLSVPASIGFIVLFGVAVLNGVVLVSRISQLQQEGRTIHDAIIEGCFNRLRPVLMTAAIAIFSLIPMLYAAGPGSEIQRPLATVVVGGLFTSTFLTLIVVPVLYGWFGKEKE